MPIALVTGANHGIGAAVAIGLARDGYDVFLAWYKPDRKFSDQALEEAKSAGIGGLELFEALQQQPVDEVSTAIESLGRNTAAAQRDLSDPNNIPTLFDECESGLGTPDVLVVNHTHSVMETFDSDTYGKSNPVTASEIDQHFAVNSRATALLMSEFQRRRLSKDLRGGRIVTISTDAADVHPRNVSYAASKNAMESYTRSAAVEMGKHGITANIVAPGPIQTGYITPEFEAEIAEKTPLGRVGTPDDVADVVRFLASDSARWITGETIFVGGGWQMRR